MISFSKGNFGEILGTIAFLIILFATSTNFVYAADITSRYADLIDRPTALNFDQLKAQGCIFIDRPIVLGVWADTVKYDDGLVPVKPAPGGTSLTPASNDHVFCPRTVADALPPDSNLSSWQKSIIWIINEIIGTFISFGIWLMSFTSSFMGYFLGATQYTTHPFVKTGWPFIQGIANFGFILALLFIAAATTLRLENFAIKRMLPRLLIAALLINFSLVIAAVCIDASRLLMAILVNATGTTNDFSKIGENIIKSSSILTGLFKNNAFQNPGDYSWMLPFSLLRATMMVYALLLAMDFVAALLAARYIILIVLLIFSPIAYLALAFPNAQGLANKWWSEFLKWVMYGPILLFFLILVTQLDDGFKIIGQDTFTTSLLKIAITCVLLIVAAQAGKQLAGAGGAGVIAAVSGNQKRLKQFATNRVVGASKSAYNSKPVTLLKDKVNRGAGLAGRTALNATGLKNVADYYGERRKIVDKKRTKAEEERRKYSTGTMAALARHDPDEYKKRVDTQNWVNDVKNAPKGSSTGTPFGATRLRNNEVQKAVKPDQVKDMVARAKAIPGSNDDQIEVVVNSSDLVAKLDETGINDLLSVLKTRIGTTRSNDEKQQLGGWIKAFNQSIQRAAQKPSEAPKKS